jgi:putative hydrolases of HD superfamily
MDADALADAAELVASLALRFGEIERTACQHPDGRPETDSTHTVMLAWLAPALAALLLYPDVLDPFEVAADAGIHDAVEVFAGDTPTLRITPGERAAKRAREADAVRQWEDALGASLPWLPMMIARYERRETPSARFVWAVDKCLPALVHASNGARDLAEYGVTADEQDERRRHHRAEMSEYAAEFPLLLDLRDVLSARLLVLLRRREAGSASAASHSRLG